MQLTLEPIKKLRDMKFNFEKYTLEKFQARVGWVVTDTYKQVQETQLMLVASSLAYTTILSIVPMMAVSFAVFQQIGGLDKLYVHVQPLIIGNLAEGTSDDAMAKIQEIIQNVHGGAVGATGFVALLFTSMTMFWSADRAINRVWSTVNTRHWFYRLSSYWAFLSFGPLSLAFIIAYKTSNEMSLGNILPAGAGAFFLQVVFFFAVYSLVPHRRVNFVPALSSAVFTTTCWTLARVGYGFYTSNVVSYSKIYGSLGAIPIILLWIWINWLIILMGAALGAALQKHMDDR